MLGRVLNPPVRVGNEVVTTVDEAAYSLRQFAVDSGDRYAWKLARALREADNEVSLQSVEGRLRAWALMNARQPN